MGGAVGGVVGGTVTGGGGGAAVVGGNVGWVAGTVPDGAGGWVTGAVAAGDPTDGDATDGAVVARGADEFVGDVGSEPAPRGAAPAATAPDFGRTFVTGFGFGAAPAGVDPAGAPATAVGNDVTAALATGAADWPAAMKPARPSVAENATPPANMRAPEAACVRARRGGTVAGISRRSRVRRPRASGAWSSS